MGNKILILDSYEREDTLSYLSKYLDFDYDYIKVINRPVAKGEKIKSKEVKENIPRITKNIKEYKYILLIGAQALEATIGGKITQLSGTVVSQGGGKFVPTLSPGMIFREPSKAEDIERALNNFKSLVKHQKEVTLPETNFKLLSNLNDIKEAFEYLEDMDYREVSYDIETTGLYRYNHQITAIGFGNNKIQFILPLEIKYSPLRGRKLLQVKYLRYIINRLNKLDIRVAGNGKFDNLFLKNFCGKKPYLDFDVVLASHALDENIPHGVNSNAMREFNVPDWDINLNVKKGNIITHKDYDTFLKYLSYDIYFEYKLYKRFSRKLKKDPSIDKLFKHLYMPVIRCYEEVEEFGVPVAQDQFDQVDKYLKSQLADVQARLDKVAPGVNWNSTSQVSDVLYKKLKLPILDRTPTGNPSTGESVLLRLKDKHPVIENILSYRGIGIQISHFIEGWKKWMVDGYLHPSFKLLTVTGRTSCADPNLQQVPRDPKIRSLIATPHKDWVIVECDYSQAELRIAAMASGDHEMMEVYTKGGDIHTKTFEMISGEKVSDDPHIKKEQRKKAKAVNFGFVYGMEAPTFQDYARDSYGVNLTLNEAKEYRANFFKVYSSLPQWHKKQKGIAKMMGQVRNPIGRLRRLPDINSSDRGKRAEAGRQSINSPVQGFGSDLTTLSLAEINGYSKSNYPPLDKKKFKSLGTIHDAILFLVRIDYLEVFLPTVNGIMKNPWALKNIFNYTPNLPLEADSTVGTSWGEGIEIDYSKPLGPQLEVFTKKIT